MEKNKKQFEKSRLKGVLFSVIMFFFLGGAYGQIISELSGHYKGNAKIIVDWCNLDILSFDLNIDKSGNITGKVGDAIIIKGKVEKNRFGSTKFIIEAELDGYIIEKEEIKRKTIKIPFDIIDGKIVGGFGTSGSKIGGKEKMILSGTDLVLVRQ